LLKRDHPPPNPRVLSASGVKPRASRRACLGDGRRLVRGEVLGQRIQCPAEVQRQYGRQGELLKLGAGELVEVLPRYSRRTRPLAVRTIALVVAHLLEPEAGRGRVEHPKQLQMPVLTSLLRQLDHRRSTI